MTEPGKLALWWTIVLLGCAISAGVILRGLA